MVWKDSAKRLCLNILYVVSIVPSFGLVFVIWAFLAFGACYTNCDDLTDHWYIVIVLPFSLPAIMAVFAVRRWIRGLPPRRLHYLISAIFGFGLSVLALWFAVTDHGDAQLHLSILLPLGVGIAIPKVFAMIAKPELV